MTEAPHTVILVDDHPLVLEAMAQLLSEGGFAVLGTATSREEARRLLAERRSDVVVLDLQLGGQLGREFLRELRSAHPQTVVVVLSDSAESGAVSEALAEGASAYVLKSADPRDLLTAVRQAVRQSLYFPMAAGMLAAGEPARAASDLTVRELEILQLVAEGRSNDEVARMLWITQQTVKFHLSNVYRKIGVSNRTEASRWAQLRGLLLGRGEGGR
jgi:DNA-binding NarL/FixJ family response regulator